MNHVDLDSIEELDPDEFMAAVKKVNPEFVEAYEKLTEEGKSDSWGGMESRRVYQEWVEGGQPANIEEFIADSAT